VNNTATSPPPIRNSYRPSTISGYKRSSFTEIFSVILITLFDEFSVKSDGQRRPAYPRQAHDALLHRNCPYDDIYVMVFITEKTLLNEVSNSIENFKYIFVLRENRRVLAETIGTL